VEASDDLLRDVRGMRTLSEPQTTKEVPDEPSGSTDLDR
jgi:hypothetical protein